MHQDRFFSTASARNGNPVIGIELPSLIETFRQATRLEAAFWEIGMHCGNISRPLR